MKIVWLLSFLSCRVSCTATVRRLRTWRQMALPTVPPIAVVVVVRTRLRPLAFQCLRRLLTLTCVGSL